MSAEDSKVRIAGVVNQVNRVEGSPDFIHVHLYMSNCPGVVTLRVPLEQAKYYVPGSTVFMEAWVMT